MPTGNSAAGTEESHWLILYLELFLTAIFESSGNFFAVMELLAEHFEPWMET